jgi:hypothetical protein
MKRRTPEPLMPEPQAEPHAIAATRVAETAATEMQFMTGLSSAKIELPRQGSILAALRRSPFDGAELNFVHKSISVMTTCAPG